MFAPLPKIGSLRLIIDAAEWLGLSSEQAEQISISNGSEILNLARIAIRRQDREALEQLFEQAARLTCTDLRIELFGHRGAVVAVSKTVIGGKNRVTLLMPEEQVYRVRNKTRVSIEYAEAAEDLRIEMRNLPYQEV